GAPAGGMPVPPLALPGAAAQRLQRPDHHMRHSGPDLMVTTWAPVGLRRRRQVPYPPALVPPGLHRVDPAPHPRQVQRLGTAGPPAPGVVAARTHTPTLRIPAHRPDLAGPGPKPLAGMATDRYRKPAGTELV